MMEPIPSIDKAFSLVIQEERQRALGFNTGISVESTALAVKNQGSNQSGKNFKGNAGKGRPTCSHCGKIGHFMEKCYQLVSYPPGYKQKNKVAMANQVTLDSESTHSEGAHQINSFPFTSEQCQQLLSLLSSQASTSASNDAIQSTNSALSSISHDFLQDSNCLNMKQSIFAVNPANKTTNNEETWVLDIGAIDHIIHSITLFTKITSSVTSFVQLPNGEQVTVTHIGTIQITPTLTLENVLCVPAFTFNLISMSKLTKSLSCCLVFLSNYCFIQDLTC